MVISKASLSLHYKSKDMKRKSKKQEPTLEQRIAEIKKPQTDVFGKVIQPVSDSIIEKWVNMVLESISVDEKCQTEYARRAKGEEFQLNKDQYELLHAKSTELNDMIKNFRFEIQRQTGFFLKWAI